MKLLCVILLAVTLCHNVFLQKNNLSEIEVFTWEEAKNADPDTIYAISFKKNKLKEIPVKLSKYTKLVYLDFQRNKLTYLPESIDTLIHLKYLNISKNKFDVFPLAITRLFELETLIASRNNFKRIPENIKYCSELIKIDLWDTPIEFFPDGFFELHKLKELDLSNIRFSPKHHKRIVSIFGNINLQIDAPCDCMD